jgi:large subunit ribosomal protein L10e
MRHSYGKPIGVAARVNIGQILLSVRSRDQHEKFVVEAIRRGKFKFAGRQKNFEESQVGIYQIPS